jgi:hypothetical protein
MTDKKEEITRLLTLYRKGHIGEDVLLEQMAAVEAEQGDGGQARLGRDGSLIEMLDGYRAAEASGAETLLAWAELTGDLALEGALRAIAAREASHAALLEQRIRELGGTPLARIPDWLARYNAALTDPDADDVEKLGAIVGQFPDVDEALVPLQRTIEGIVDDELTREMLRTICADELATLEWAHEAYAARAKDS